MNLKGPGLRRFSEDIEEKVKTNEKLGSTLYTQNQ
jgi:hypothetical protein